jgi:hypothetical protein
MAQRTSRTALLAALIGISAAGCASSPVSPFNQLEKSNLIVLRLQNYEPPAPPAAQAAAPVAPLLQNLPPEIQTWIQQGAQGLQQLIPPGLLPGITGNAAASAAPVPDAPRFYGFRILGQTQVADPDMKKQIAELFGDKDHFEAPKSSCLYPELGFSFGPGPGSPSNDFLVSFSCNQVQARSFPWPHPYTGMKADTVSSLTEVGKKLWPGG